MSERRGSPIHEYLHQKGCAEHVVSGGLSHLMASWEALAGSVARGEPQEYYEYLNDLSSRTLLAELMTALPAWLPLRILNRIAAADARIRPHLVPLPDCIWGEHVAQAEGYTPEREWWLFNRPEVVDDDWAEDAP